MNRITTILPPGRPPSSSPSPRSRSLTAPAITTQRVTQQTDHRAAELGSHAHAVW
jgi:hypothetical protein